VTETPGAFWAEEWPVARAEPVGFFPQADGTLATTPGAAGRHELVYQPDTGAGLLSWWAETTGDARPADATALLYDSAPLAETRYLLGFPTARLTVSADAPLAQWVVRLEDVWPDGRVSFVTGGAINGAQRESRSDPQPLVPGETYRLEIPLRFTTWTFAPGHRIRLAIANGQFGLSWPTPHAMTTTLHVGSVSEITLPFVAKNDRPPPPLLPPEPREPRPGGEWLESDSGEEDLLPVTHYRATLDAETGMSTLTASEASAWRVADRVYRSAVQLSHRVDTHAPARAGFQGEGSYEIDLGERTIAVRAAYRIDSDEEAFHVSVRREIAENGEAEHAREWRESIPRDLQ
jgi:hypothetical protein